MSEPPPVSLTERALPRGLVTVAEPIAPITCVENGRAFGLALLALAGNPQLVTSSANCGRGCGSWAARQEDTVL